MDRDLPGLTEFRLTDSQKAVGQGHVGPIESDRLPDAHARDHEKPDQGFVVAADNGHRLPGHAISGRFDV